jgi:hypothetical protein
MQGPGAPAERYEPLPGVLGLPAHFFRKLSPRGRRIALATGLLLLGALVATAITLAPRISESKREQEARERREAAQSRAAERARLVAEQRPRLGRLAASAAGTPSAAAIAELEELIARDARARVASGELSTRVREADCRTVTRRGARFLLSCTAVTSRVEASAGGSAVLVGYPYRAALAPASGRYGFCKVSERPAEGLLGKLPAVTLPRACGG